MRNKSYRKYVGVVLPILLGVCVRNLPAQTQTMSLTSSQEASKAILLLHTNLSVREIANEITVAVAPYGLLTPNQLRESTDLKKRETIGTSEIITLERKTGISEEFAVYGDHITSLHVTDKNKNAFTINYHTQKGRHQIGNFSQDLRGKAEGPYIEWYADGSVRAIAWFTGGKLAKVEIWDQNGKLTDSKVFPEPVDVMPKPGLSRGKK